MHSFQTQSIRDGHKYVQDLVEILQNNLLEIHDTYSTSENFLSFNLAWFGVEYFLNNERSVQGHGLCTR